MMTVSGTPSRALKRLSRTKLTIRKAALTFVRVSSAPSAFNGILTKADAPHAYISFTDTPAPAIAISNFQSLTYQKPDPWRPSPVIMSLGRGFSLDTSTSLRSMDEWINLASGAQRNVPMLLVGPPAYGISKVPGREGNMEIWNYQNEMNKVAVERHIDVLGLWNLTVQASSSHGERYGAKVAMVEAMMVINWLSKLETS